MIYNPELFFTEFNIDHKAIEHYNLVGKTKNFYKNRKELYKNYKKDLGLKIDTRFYYNYY